MNNLDLEGPHFNTAGWDQDHNGVHPVEMLARIAKFESKKVYMDDREQHSSIPFKKLLKPSDGWAVPFVTGHKYKISFGLVGLDFEQMSMEASWRWEEWDKSIYFVHNFTDVRAKIDFFINGHKNDKAFYMTNNSIPAKASDYKFG